MKKITKAKMWALIAELRSLAPHRPLSYGESLQVARVQAARLRRWLEASEQPDINLIWLVEQTAVPVSFVASYKLGEESGMTTDERTGSLEMLINGSEPPLRQRFSLLHEFKHVLDFDNAPTLHKQLGGGITERRKVQVELIANEFAGHVLMPAPLVKREWVQWQDLATVANIFNVSVEAMAFRLQR